MYAIESSEFDVLLEFVGAALAAEGQMPGGVSPERVLLRSMLNNLHWGLTAIRERAEGKSDALSVTSFGDIFGTG